MADNSGDMEATADDPDDEEASVANPGTTKTVSSETATSGTVGTGTANSGTTNSGTTESTQETPTLEMLGPTTLDPGLPLQEPELPTQGTQNTKKTQ